MVCTESILSIYYMSYYLHSKKCRASSPYAWYSARPRINKSFDWNLNALYWLLTILFALIRDETIKYWYWLSLLLGQNYQQEHSTTHSHCRFLSLTQCMSSILKKSLSDYLLRLANKAASNFTHCQILQMILQLSQIATFCCRDLSPKTKAQVLIKMRDGESYCDLATVKHALQYS